MRAWLVLSLVCVAWCDPRDYFFEGKEGCYFGIDPSVTLKDRTFTVQAMVQIDQQKNWPDQPILGDSQTQHGNDKSLHLVIRQNKPHMGFYGNDLRANMDDMRPRRWYHVTFVFEKDATGGSDHYQTIFVDGVQVGRRKTGRTFQGESALRIGYALSRNRVLGGRIGDLKIWLDQARTSDLLSDRDATDYPAGQQPTVWYNFEDGAGAASITEVADKYGGPAATKEGDCDANPVAAHAQDVPPACDNCVGTCMDMDSPYGGWCQCNDGATGNNCDICRRDKGSATGTKGPGCSEECSCNPGEPYEMDDSISAELVAEVKEAFPESRDEDINPLYLDWENPNLHCETECTMSCSFVHEGAGHHNEFGWFTYNAEDAQQTEASPTDSGIIFHDASMPICVQPGSRVSNIGPFPAGTNLGWWVHGDGWCRNDGWNPNVKFWSIDAWNKDGQKRHVAVKDDLQADAANFVVGFEDLWNLGDQDWNDVMFICTVDGDVTPLKPKCGNGQIDEGEECDVGDRDNNDGCDERCQFECGNGHIEAPLEACDDGNRVDDNNGCSASCTLTALCGDGTLDQGEDCDPGEDVEGDGCSADCKTVPFCGDGTVDEGEECDDGNPTAHDGCTGCVSDNFPDCEVNGADCYTALLASGDAVVGEVKVKYVAPGKIYAEARKTCGSCDVSAVLSDSYVLQDTADNKIFTASAQSLVYNVDGASPDLLGFNAEFEATADASYKLEFVMTVGGVAATTGAVENELTPSFDVNCIVCGDGNLDEGEDCDDANTDDTDGCTAECKSTCGDGVVSGDEECDDDNQCTDCQAACFDLDFPRRQPGGDLVPAPLSSGSSSNIYYTYLPRWPATFRVSGATNLAEAQFVVRDPDTDATLLDIALTGEAQEIDLPYKLAEVHLTMDFANGNSAQTFTLHMCPAGAAAGDDCPCQSFDVQLTPTCLPGAPADATCDEVVEVCN